MSSSTNQQPAPPIPLTAPSTTSANPSSSAKALWTYIEPALFHILRSPSNDPSKAPVLDVAYHVGIHTAVYNYFTAPDSNQPSSPLPPLSELAFEGGGGGGGDDFRDVIREGLYSQLDDYFAEVAREILLGAAQDESTLIQYLVPAFTRFSSGARSVDRLLNYVNRHYVKRVASEDKGWLSISDLIDPEELSTIRLVEARAKLSVRLRDRRAEELKKWGYDPDVDSPERRAEAESSAEAASGLDRVVPLVSLAHRRFRVEVLEPLLAVPKSKGKGKKKGKAKVSAAAAAAQSNGGAEKPSGPKGRLARAVKELLESKEGDEQERRTLAEGVGRMLAVTGVRPEHPLRRRLRTYLDKTTT